jgi:hypothetical protein
MAKNGVPTLMSSKPSASMQNFHYWYPLMDWGFDRERCKQIIANAGLPVPVKSAWWFCPASKKHEIAWLQEHHPELLERALEIERNAQAKLALPLLDACDC